MTEYTYEEFHNATDLKFVDISSEMYREYDYGDEKIRIQKPIALNVSKSGGHRVFDASGKSHYINPGWKHLMWEVKQGFPHFVA